MENELTHYGIKGMKWGVRRTPAQLGHDLMKKHKENSADRREKYDSKRRARAQREIEKAGSKERALTKIDRHADNRGLVKKGAAFTVSTAAKIGSLASAANLASGVVLGTAVLSFPAASLLATPAGVVGLGVTGAVVSKYGKSVKRTPNRRERERMEYIRNA